MEQRSAAALKEFADRRQKALRLLKKSVGVIFAGEQDSQWNSMYRPHAHFEYLTGVTDEPGAMLVLDPTAPIERRRAMLFLRPLNPEIEKWDGYRLEVGKALRDKTGFDALYRHAHLPNFLGAAAVRSKSLACLHPLALHNQPVSPDFALFKQLAERIPGVSIIDRSELLPTMRALKSRAEVALMQKAVDITAIGFDRAMKAVRPGMNEFALQETIEHAYRESGSRALAFSTIVGSGINSTVLHYRANDKIIEDGDLICIDSGATWSGYAADVTRTIPANGTFTPRQREVYEIVLKAEEAAIKACKPGKTLAQLDQVARSIIDKAGFGDSFIHSIGHHLGLEAHDAAPPDAPLAEGAVVTIEPGIYLPDEKIGIRIEDDVLVTKAGPKVLTRKIPKKVAEIERAMRGNNDDGRVTVG